MIDPSAIDFSVLPSVHVSDYQSLPDICGIYIAVDELLQPLYIGQSQSIMTRWRNHPQLAGLQSRGQVWICYCEVDKASLDAVELVLIRHYRPPLNKLDNPDWEVKQTPSNWMAEARIARGLTQKQLAEALGITDATVRNWEKGRSEPVLNLVQHKKLYELIPEYYKPPCHT